MAKTTTINLLQKRDIGQVLNAGFSLLASIKPLYKDILFLSAPVYLLSGICSALSEYNHLLEGFNSNFAYNIYYFLFSPFWYLSILFLLLGQSVTISIVCNHVLQYRLNGGSIYDLQATRKAIFRDIPKVFFAGFLNTIIIIAACVLFLIPGIYFAVANSLVVTALVLDKKNSVVDAFSESSRLIRDNWWLAFLLGIIVSLIMLGLVWAITITTGIATRLISFHSINAVQSSSYSIFLIVLSCFKTLCYSLINPISAAISSVYYYSLKETKDQVGLMESIDSIGGQLTHKQEDEGSY